MEWLDSLNLPPQLAGVATFIFILAGAVFAAWSRLQGKKEGPPQPKVQEFYAAGQLADMGPVKELVEQAGLLFQQQVRTNIALEKLATLWAEDLEARRKAEAERDLDEEVRRRVAEEVRTAIEEIEQAPKNRRPPRQ